MKITRDNYEIYALDYLEGQLDPEVHQEFISFLAANKDISEELAGFTLVTLPVEENIKYSGKQVLYKKSNRLTGLFFLSPNLNVAAAIALLLAMSIGWMVYQSSEQNQSTLSDEIATETKIIDDPIEVKSPAETLPKAIENKSDDVAVDQIEIPVVNQEERSNDSSDFQENSGDRPNKPHNFSKATPKDLAVQNSSEVAQINAAENIATTPRAVDGGEDIGVDANAKLPSVPEVNTMKLLPTMIPSQKVNYNRDLTAYMVKHEDLKRHKTSFEIHIPGELLSDTWTDMSFIHLKEKLLPEFIKN